VVCSFAHDGFKFSNGATCIPCGVCYHPRCFQAGPPFYSRRKNQAGLTLPSNIRQWAHFICESCTVRSVLDRELDYSKDWRLMCLERMRILDMAHSWSAGTHNVYQQKLAAIRRFEKGFGVPVLTRSALEKPPCGPEVTLSWAQEHYSLRPGKADDTRVNFGTVRQLRSAASQFFAWDMMVTNPGSTIMDPKTHHILQIPCRATDDLSANLFASGLSARIGNEPKPSVALLERHVKWIGNDLEHRYQSATTPALRREFAQAGFANACFWLGWLRSEELFTRTFEDITVIEPRHAASVDLPRGCGAVTMNLGLESKGRRDVYVDVVMAYRTFAGIRLGRWFHRVRRAHGLGRDWKLCPTRVFMHQDGKRWTSAYYRKTYLWPCLEEQRRQGDPFLRAFDGSPGNSIRDKFWSIHAYRRGARSHVSKRRLGQYRKASKDQVYEHARWKRSRRSEAIDVIYREWTLPDRIQLTLYSQ